MASRDIYGRRPTSTSRGRTIERIMDRQHPAGIIPGAEAVLASAPPGSIAESITAFHRAWVEPRPVTTRRAYERSLALFARDLAECGPSPEAPVAHLTPERLLAHLDWRLARSLADPGELQRASLHLTRLCEWVGERDGIDLGVDRGSMREQVVARIASAPPPFHAARRSAELRDTSGDAETLGDV